MTLFKTVAQMPCLRRYYNTIQNGEKYIYLICFEITYKMIFVRLLTEQD